MLINGVKTTAIQFKKDIMSTEKKTKPLTMINDIFKTPILNAKVSNTKASL